MKRESIVIKGYDCREICTDPRHKDTFGKAYATPGQTHGQHVDEWKFVLTDGESAVVLTVFSNKASTTAKWPKPPEGAHFTFHYPWRQTTEDLREERVGFECDVIPAGRCFGDASYRYAEEFFKEHGSAQFEQPERFWLAFEKYAAEQIAESRANAAEFRVKRCATCAGTGVVPRLNLP
jgi:hypothetical protein